MKYLAHYETLIVVEADSFQEARDKAIAIYHSTAVPGPNESIETELVFVEDENGADEEGHIIG